MKFRVILRWILAPAVVLVIAYLWLARPPPPEAKLTRVTLAVPELDEASGLAVSHTTAALLWSHNDSGGQPVLYAFGFDGKPFGRVRITGATNRDWEAIDSFDLDGQSWLAAADIGDNYENHKTATIYVIAEPRTQDLSDTKETMAPIAWTITLRYPDGPRDCETMMVDLASRQFLIVAKRSKTHIVYAVPLRPPPNAGVITASQVAIVRHFPQSNGLKKLMPIPTGRYRDQPTDGCITRDGLTAAILTYGDVLLFHRAPNETWETAFARVPDRLAPHHLPQAEGLCFAENDHTLFVTSEGKNASLVRYDLDRK